MSLDHIPFAQCREVYPRIVEVVAHSGIEITAADIDLIEKRLCERYTDYYSLLIHRRFSYSHTFESMVRVSKLKNLMSMAIVAYGGLAFSTAEIHRRFDRNVRVYDNYDDAYGWLVERIDMVGLAHA